MKTEKGFKMHNKQRKYIEIKCTLILESHSVAQCSKYAEFPLSKHHLCQCEIYRVAGIFLP